MRRFIGNSAKDFTTRLPGRSVGSVYGAMLLSVATCLLSLPANATGPGVRVALTPAFSTTVAPNTDFTLSIQVTQAGSSFNGFDAVVSFDTSKLSFVSEGAPKDPYMTTACGLTSPYFPPYNGSDSLVVSDVLLCNGMSLTGPGIVYNLRFRTKAQSAYTFIRLRGVSFANAGHYVLPVRSTDALIHVAAPTDTRGPEASSSTVSLRTSPNPFNPSTVIYLHADLAGPQTLSVTDVLGRRVRLLQRGQYDAGNRQVTWDGRSDSGMQLGSGIYVVTLNAAGKTAVERVVLLK